MGKLLLTGVDGNLGRQAAEYLLKLVEKDQIIFVHMIRHLYKGMQNKVLKRM